MDEFNDLLNRNLKTYRYIQDCPSNESDNLVESCFSYIMNSTREEDDKLERYVEDLVLQVNTSALVLKLKLE